MSTATSAIDIVTADDSAGQRAAGSAGAAARGATIRVAVPDEWDEVARVSYLGFNHGREGSREPSPERLALLRDAAGRAASGELLVAVDDETGRVLGTASLLRAGTPHARQARDGEAELRLLAVLPEARRRGIGRALMREAIERARSWGVPALVLDTGPGNVASQALYAGLGFIRMPERETVRASSGGFLVVFRYAFDAKLQGATT